MQTEGIICCLFFLTEQLTKHSTSSSGMFMVKHSPNGPYIWPENWILQCDSVPSNTEFSMKRFLAKNQIPVMEYQPHCTHLAMFKFSKFSKLEISLEGSHFDSFEDAQCNMTILLKGPPENEIQRCF